MPITHIPVSVPDAATYTVDADNAGLSHYIPNLTADTVITLPAPKAGLWFDFVYAGIAADAQDWLINTGSNTNYFVGGLVFMDQDGDALAPIAGDGNSNSKLTILTPEPGTRIRVESTNGVTWTLSGYVLSATVPSFADQ
jgi:hypothetical protein